MTGPNCGPFLRTEGVLSPETTDPTMFSCPLGQPWEVLNGMLTSVMGRNVSYQGDGMLVSVGEGISSLEGW